MQHQGYMNTAWVLHTVAQACAWSELLLYLLCAGPTFLGACATGAYGLGFDIVRGIAGVRLGCGFLKPLASWRCPPSHVPDRVPPVKAFHVHISRVQIS